MTSGLLGLVPYAPERGVTADTSKHNGAAPRLRQRRALKRAIACGAPLGVCDENFAFKAMAWMEHDARMMGFGVIRPGQDFEVRQSIVCFVAVFMMHLLPARQWSLQRTLHDPSMLQLKPAPARIEMLRAINLNVTLRRFITLQWLHFRYILPIMFKKIKGQL